MEDFVHTLNAVIWSPALVAFCLGAGLFFSIKSRFVQLRLIPEMWRLLFQKKEDEIGLSSFQALSLTLAGRVGTGNIAGVATAICFGGPGALFWMWVVAFLGASSAFVESTLGQIYKERIEGQYRGGPAFYIERGLKLKAYAWAFAIVTILASCFFCPGVQSNSIALAWNEAFGLDAEVTAAIVASITCFVIVGGLRRIATFTSWVVPFMAQAYIVVALIIVGVNWEQIPAVMTLIVNSAFGFDSLTGGMLGAAIAWGVKRGIYSNEAGQGTGPHASSAAAVSHPAKQGLVQAFSVYIDTLFVCSATGFMILMTGWDGECDLIDPMCGSGTIPIEAALIARNIAPGVFRKEFAFEKWNDFDQELFDRIYNDDSQEREFTHKIFGYDNNPKANEIATHNVKAAGLSKEIILKIQPFQQFEQPKEKSIIITNPPYGERISTNDLLGLYQMIGERLKHSFTGNDAWVLSYREECFDQIGLKPSIKIPLFNGSLECEFRKYQLFNGKFKEFRSENADQEFKPRREEIRPRRNTEKVEYGERRERRSFDNRREGHGEYKGGERRERRSFDDKREGRGDFKRGEHRNFGDRREGRDNFKSSPRKFDDNKEKTEE